MTAEEIEEVDPKRRMGALPEPPAKGCRWSRWPGARQLLLVSSVGALCLIMLLYLPLDPLASWGLDVSSEDRLIDSILDSVPLTDGHNDLAIWLRAFYGNHIYQLNTSTRLSGQVDPPRLLQSRLGAQFWSAYVPCAADDPDGPSDPVSATLQQIDLLHRLAGKFPAHLEMVSDSCSVWSHFRRHKHPRPVASMLSLEGLHALGDSPSALRTFYRAGVRVAGLTHDCNNAFADAALAPAPLHHGLSTRGERLLTELHRLGIIADLSHSSTATQRDVLGLSRAPVIFSHSGAEGVCAHPRNVPDDVLDMVRQNGGVVMVTFMPAHLVDTEGDTEPQASLHDVVRHILYICNRIGSQHVGIGSDFDGMQDAPRGLEDVAAYPSLVRALIRAQLSRSQVEGIVGRNILRVLARVEAVSREMSGAQILEDDLTPWFNASISG